MEKRKRKVKVQNRKDIHVAIHLATNVAERPSAEIAAKIDLPFGLV
jgi:hypothetical protein